MNINAFKLDLEGFTGTLQYHKLSVFPVYATDGVAYFCEKAECYWLFDDMSAFAMGNPDKEFIVAIAKAKDNVADVIYEDGNKNRLYKQHYNFTSLIDGEWKFFISNYPTQKVIMLPSEY